MDRQYEDMLEHVLNRGVVRTDRTGTGTHSIFGYQLRYDLSKGFPLISTKKVFTKGIIHELLWFLSGDTNIKYLKDNGVNIWNDWADEDGNLGNVYGKQWRDIEGIDQISEVVESLKNNPDSRRHLVVSWNVAELSTMALPPCHCLFQFYVAEGKLSCQLYQRSADVFLGVPFNIASYALLTHMIAQQCDLDVGEFIWTGGDVHLYSNHVEQAREQLGREVYGFPSLVIWGKPDSIFDYRYEDFEFVGYISHPPIKAPIAV